MTHRPPTPARTLAPAAVAFRCEVTAHDLSGSREVVLAYYRATSPRLAGRWMRVQSRRLARLLAPESTAPHMKTAPLVAMGPNCARPDDDLLAWAGSDERYEQTLRVLSAGNSYLLSVTDYDARYSVRVYALPTRTTPLQSFAPDGRCRYAPAVAGHHRKPRRRRFSR